MLSIHRHIHFIFPYFPVAGSAALLNSISLCGIHTAIFQNQGTDPLFFRPNVVGYFLAC